MSGRLEGRHVVVVGGSSGIGHAVAVRALAEGARVTLGSRSADRLAAAARGLVGEVETCVMDVDDDASVVAAFECAGPCDHVVVSVSSGRTGPFPDADVATARPFVDVQLWGTWRVARAAQRVMAEDGSITLVSGTYGQMPGDAIPPVVMAKAGLDALARSLAVSMAPRRVNAVAPGPVETPLWTKLYPDAEARVKALAEAAERSLVGRVGRPEEVADAVTFLMGNGFATGTVLTLDGGFTLS